MEQLLQSTAAYKIFAGDAEADRLSHAYMLDFPDVKNMRGALKIFALKFFRAQRGGSVEHRILNESYTDFKIYPEEGKKLTAEAVNALLDDCALKPVEGAKRLYCICGFEQAPPLLQNKLLKTLEEPLEGIHFLLGTASLAPVLDTVKSRVKLLEIPPFSAEQIFAALERKASKPVNRRAAESCNGVLGVAESMAEGGWFEEVSSAARELCSITRVGDIGEAAIKYGDTKYKNELLGEMQRLYFSALDGRDKLPLLRPALIFALEKLNLAFADVRFNAVFGSLLYDLLLEVVKENEKWQKLSA